MSCFFENKNPGATAPAIVAHRQFAALWAEVRAASSRQAGTQPKPETMEDDSEDSELDPNLIRRVVDAASEGALSKPASFS